MNPLASTRQPDRIPCWGSRGTGGFLCHHVKVVSAQIGNVRIFSLAQKYVWEFEMLQALLLLVVIMAVGGAPLTTIPHLIRLKQPNRLTRFYRAQANQTIESDYLGHISRQHPNHFPYLGYHGVKTHGRIEESL